MVTEGPLANPAGVKRQVVGVYDAALVPVIARVLAGLGAARAMVVHGEDGMDELSLASATHVAHVDAVRGIWTETLVPGDAGLRPAGAAALRGGGPAENARHLEELLLGRSGPLADGASLNAGAALVVAGIAATVREGVALARESIMSGRAHEVLVKLRREAHGTTTREEIAS